MRALLIFCLLACGRSQSVSDQELRGLVVADKPADDKIDVDRAAKEPDELTRALARPLHLAAAAIGPHALAIDTTTVTEQGGAQVENLADQVAVEMTADGAWHGTYTNSADYGRETIWAKQQLYLRPRYQRWHGRAPETPEEPQQLLDGYGEAVGAVWDLLAPGAELTDGGVVQISGRAGRKILVKQAPSMAPLPAEPLAQRAWRAHRTIDSVQGEVVLDADTGVPLAVKLTGAIGFQREGKSFAMKLGVTSTLVPGAAAAIAAPPPTDVVATPERAREVDDRDLLLQGMAPPLRKSDTETKPTKPAEVKK